MTLLIILLAISNVMFLIAALDAKIELSFVCETNEELVEAFRNIEEALDTLELLLDGDDWDDLAS